MMKDEAFAIIDRAGEIVFSSNAFNGLISFDGVERILGSTLSDWFDEGQDFPPIGGGVLPGRAAGKYYLRA